MKLRKAAPGVTLDEAVINSASFMESPDELHQLDERELRLLKLEDAIGCLNEQQRICVELFYLKEKSYKEITDETGYSLNEVKSYLQNARRNLKMFMTKGND